MKFRKPTFADFDYPPPPPWEEEEMKRAKGARKALEMLRGIETKQRIAKHNAEHETSEGNPLEDWVWIADAFQFVRRDGLLKYRPDQWKSLFGWLQPKGDLLAAIWRDELKIRKCKQLAYVPEQDEFLDGGATYNIWRPSGVDAREGDTRWFEDHLAYLLPDAMERDHLLDFLAFNVQCPGEKVLYAPLLYSATEGVGKSAIGLLMSRIIGSRNVVRPSTEEVSRSYTVWQEGAQLGIIEELMAEGSFGVANKLKTVITEPQLRISEKFKTDYSIPNHLNLMCFTNHADALKLENGERRWMIFECKAAPRGEDYYDDLFDNHIKTANGPAAVKHLLMTRDLALFNPKGRAPNTAAKDEMRRLGMEDVEAYLQDAFDANDDPFKFDLVTLENVMASIPSHMINRRKNSRAVVVKFLTKDIRAAKLNRYTHGDLKPVSLWAIRNQKKWHKAGPKTCTQAFYEANEVSESV